MNRAIVPAGWSAAPDGRDGQVAPTNSEKEPTMWKQLSLISTYASIAPVEAATIRGPEDYRRIQVAIDVATDGDEVVIEASHHQESMIDFKGGRSRCAALIRRTGTSRGRRSRAGSPIPIATGRAGTRTALAPTWGPSVDRGFGGGFVDSCRGRPDEPPHTRSKALATLPASGARPSRMRGSRGSVARNADSFSSAPLPDRRRRSGPR